MTVECPSDHGALAGDGAEIGSPGRSSGVVVMVAIGRGEETLGTQGYGSISPSAASVSTRWSRSGSSPMNVGLGELAGITPHSAARWVARWQPGAHRDDRGGGPDRCDRSPAWVALGRCYRRAGGDACKSLRVVVGAC